MDRLRLDVRTESEGGPAETLVYFFINEQPLQELATVAELPYAMAEGKRELAGSYGPMTRENFRDHTGLLGQPECSWFNDGDTVLMGCTCGEWGCWPLTVQIEIGPEAVTWHRLRTGHRTWDLNTLGPFVFDRAEYEAAVSVLG
jgi:hypothetical protein